MDNLLADLPRRLHAEEVVELVRRGDVRIERIVSTGQATPEDEPYRQDHDEWVLLLAGAARVWLDGRDERTLAPGDAILIPAGTMHGVAWTDPDEPTVWLAVHFGGDT